MSNTSASRSELTALAVLAVMMAIALLFPWSNLVSKNTQNQKSKYAFPSIRAWPPKRVQGIPEWRVSTAYSSRSGTLLVKLSHRHGNPADGLRLHADFSPSGIRQPVMATWLQNQSNGNYRSDNVRLTKGEWLMSLAGSRRSELIFRLERLLRVD